MIFIVHVMSPILNLLLMPALIDDNIIELRNIVKSYSTGEKSLTILNGVSLTLRAGETCAILGASGSGKSTLLSIMGLLDRPDSGDYLFVDQDIRHASASRLADIRNAGIGFVFQGFNLLPRLTALENVALPLRYRGVPHTQALIEAHAALEQVNMASRASHRPADLSGGQRQRVAIARAIVTKPALILADEPTGNLDLATANTVMALLLSLNHKYRATLVIVTHDPAIVDRLTHQYVVENGQLTKR